MLRYIKFNQIIEKTRYFLLVEIYSIAIIKVVLYIKLFNLVLESLR